MSAEAAPKPACERCDDLHWVDDPSACGDPEHCSPIVPCPVCNPDGDIGLLDD